MAKGGAAENETCRDLGSWWGNRRDIFRRTTGSGALATQRAKKKKKTAGEDRFFRKMGPIDPPQVITTGIRGFRHTTQTTGKDLRVAGFIQ